MQQDEQAPFGLLAGGSSDPRGLDFARRCKRFDLLSVLFDSYAEAEDAWRGRAQRTIDDAEMKYVIVHLHRLLEPDGEVVVARVLSAQAER